MAKNNLGGTPLQKLELTWIGKGDEPKLEPRILIENPEYSYGDPNSENMLIHGDNLLALKALEQDYAGKVKCIYIDPPFNTGAAFEHYDDGVEHSIWLNLMSVRFKLLKNLLREDGVLMVHLDDNESAYAKVLLDEIFGRSNYLNTISLSTNDPSGFKATGSIIFRTSNHILIYALNRHKANLKKLYTEKTYDTAYNKVLINPSDSFESWQFESINEAVAKENGFSDVASAKRAFKSGFNDLVAEYAIKNSKFVTQIAAIGGGAAIKRKQTIELSKINRNKVFRHPDEDLDDFFILNGRQILFYNKRFEVIDGKLVPAELLTDVWTDISWNGIANEGDVQFKNGKKPENLIKRCIELTTQQGDIILDSFLGSGTTAAVAHKMGRRWIGVELGEHAKTHCVPRMQQVVDGVQGGISKAVNWQGGGGFKFYSLAPSLLKQDKFGNWVISGEYNADMLAAAMAKQEGFKYQPHESTYWKQGKSSEQDFIFTTTQFLTVEALDSIKDEMQADESLLICCKSFQATCKGKYGNITIKKIPQMLLGRCEYGKEDYSLNIVNMPTAKQDSEGCQDEQGLGEEHISVQEILDKSKRVKKKQNDAPSLFD